MFRNCQVLIFGQSVHEFPIGVVYDSLLASLYKTHFFSKSLNPLNTKLPRWVIPRILHLFAMLQVATQKSFSTT